jgi:hypothetical protein
MKLPQLDATKTHVLTIEGKKHKATLYMVGGRTMELYAVNTLAAAMGKTPDTVRRWEGEGLIPKPLFQVVGNNNWLDQKRWYSRAQVLNIRQAYNRFPFSAGHYHLREAFFTLANLIFDEQEEVDVNEISVRHGVTATARAAAFGGTVSIGQRSSTHVARGHRKVAGTTVRSSDGKPALANAAATEGTAPEKSQPGIHKPVVAPAGQRNVVRYPEAEHRGHRAEPGSRTVEESSRHPTGGDPRTQTEGADYRRRPSGGVPRHHG